MRAYWAAVFALLVVIAVGCEEEIDSSHLEIELNTMRFVLASPSFPQNGLIPKKHTCNGDNISPGLIWKNVPENATSLALVCNDPDAPAGYWYHWVVAELPAADDSLKIGFSNAPVREASIVEGSNQLNEIGYYGPCPPSDTHRYVFTLYAFDSKMPFNQKTTGDAVRWTASGFAIDSAVLVGRYSQ